jgi:glucose-1-phosphate thymidylyltransferase
MVVTGGPHAGHFIRVLKNGEDLGIKELVYAYQDTGDGGISDALRLAEDFADGGNIAVILGDNATDADISRDIKEFKQGAKLFLKKVEDPERFGVAVFDDNDPKKIIRIEEKPKNPPSNYAVSGLYIYDNKCFDYINTLKPSDRGQLEVTDLNNKYIETNSLYWSELKGYWADAGTVESLYDCNKYWATKKGIKQ